MTPEQEALVARLEDTKLQHGEKANHIVRRYQIDRLEAAAMIRTLALLDAPALPDARAGAVAPVELAERERIAKELEAYGDCLPCIEDALVTRSNAMLIRANFSIEDAESLLLKTCAQALPTPACTATDGEERTKPES